MGTSKEKMGKMRDISKKWNITGAKHSILRNACITGARSPSKS
jgi:hypothetical protein